MPTKGLRNVRLCIIACVGQNGKMVSCRKRKKQQETILFFCDCACRSYIFVISVYLIYNTDLSILGHIKHLFQNNFCTSALLHKFPPQLTISYPTLPYPILSYPILSYPILPYPTLSYPTLSYPTLPYLILSYPTLSYPTLSYPTLPYHTLSYPTLP